MLLPLQLLNLLETGASFTTPGGEWNAAEFFPTGQNDVVITLYDPEAAAVPGQPRMK